MEKRDQREELSREAAYRSSDRDANLFNLKCLAVLAAFTVLAAVLNELGLFKAQRGVMFIAMFASLVADLAPFAVRLIIKLRGGTPAEEREWFRRLIVVCAFLGAGVLCVTLSHQTVLVMAIPPLIAAQYRESRKEFVAVLIASVLLVPAGVYGSFLFGTVDRNFIKGMLTDEEAEVFANRLALLTPERALELFPHYVMPRLLIVVAIDLLAFGITRRNGRMFDRQLALSEKVREEMEMRHRMQIHVIDTLANLIETRDAGTGEHIIRTKQYVGMIARAMREDERYAGIMTDELIGRMMSAAPLHDVGKIAIPDSILLKPGRLTPEEFEVMKTHAPKGGDIIEKLFDGIEEAPFLRMAEEIAVAHHERWDGTGYPNGLKGEEIPLSARVMAVADVFDALVSVRVYKGAISPQDALNIIYEESGTHFDPEIIRIVKGIEGDFIEASKGKRQ